MALSKESLSPAQLDRRYIWHPFTPVAQWTAGQQLIIEAGQGEYLINPDGHKYLDGVSSLWCNVHGHRVPQIQPVASLQFDLASHIPASVQKQRPQVDRAVCGADHPQPRLPCIFDPAEDAWRRVIDSIVAQVCQP